MLVKRNVYFSAIDQETGEEKLFSVSEILSEEEYLERLYSETEDAEQVEFSEKKERTKLKDVQSHRGLGRSLLVGGTPGAVGGYIGKRAANKADEEGKSDAEIMKAAKSAATKGGLAASGVGLALNAKNFKVAHQMVAENLSGAVGRSKAGKVAAASLGAGALAGTAMATGAARWGAKKNTEKRLAKRAIKDSEK